jgi:hypothetical protein
MSELRLELPRKNPQQQLLLRSTQQEENQSDILMIPVLDGATENSQLNRLHLPPRNASTHLNQ